MAITVGELLVRLGIDVGDFVGGLDSATSKVEQQMRKIGDMGETLTKAITLPLAGVATASLTAFAGFEQGMNRVSALGDIFGKDLTKLRDQAMDLGAKTQYSAKQAADAMANLAAGGFKTSEIFAAMPGVLALAATENMKIADAAQIASDTLKGYGLAASDTQKVADILAKTSSASATSVKDLGVAFSYVGPVAKALNQPMLDVAAALGVLGDAGVRGERGGTALRNILNDIVAPSKAGANALEALKIATKDAMGNLLPMEVLFRNMTPLLKDAAAAQAVFGQRWSEVVPLITKGGEAFNKTRKEIEAFEGSAKKMADIIRKGLAGNWEEFTSQLETVGIKLGDVLAPYANKLLLWVNKILDEVGKLIDGFKTLPPAVQDAVIGFGAVAAAIGPLLIAVSAAGAAFSTLQAGFATISALFSSGGMLAGVLSLEAAFVALGVALVALELKWIWEDFQRIADSLGELLPSWKQLTDFAELMYTAITALPGPFGELARMFGLSSDSVKWLGDAFGGLFNWVSKNWGQVIMASVLGPFDMARRAIHEFANSLEKLTGTGRVAQENLNVMSAGLTKMQQAAADAARKTADAVTAQSSSIKNMKMSMADLNKAISDNVGITDKQTEARKKSKKVIDEEAVAIKAALDTQRNMAQLTKLELEYTTRAHGQLMASAREYLGKLILDWKAFHAVIGNTDAWKKPSEVMKQVMEQNNAALAGAIKRTQELDGAFKTLGVSSVESLQAVRDAAAKAYEALKQGMDTGELAKSQAVLLQGQVKLLQAERDLALARGLSTKAYDEQLDAVGVKLDALGIKNKAATEEWKALWNQISTIVNDLGKDITDAILSGKNLGEVFMNTMEAMGKAVMRFVVEGMVNGLIKSIMTGKNGFEDLSKTATGAFNKIRQIFTGSTATDAAGNAVKTATDAAGGNAVKTATGALSGGLTGMVTAVGSAVSAITGVLSYLQGRRMEQDIGRIEVTTREIKAELSNLRADEWAREKHLYALSAMAEATNRFGDAHGAFLSDILGTLQEIRNILATGGFSGGGGGAVVVDTGTSPQQTAVKRLQELADQTHLANQALKAMQEQGQQTTNESYTTTEAVHDLGEAAVKTASELPAYAANIQEFVGKTSKELAMYLKDSGSKLEASMNLMNNGTQRLMRDLTSGLQFIVDVTTDKVVNVYDAQAEIVDEATGEVVKFVSAVKKVTDATDNLGRTTLDATSNLYSMSNAAQTASERVPAAFERLTDSVLGTATAIDRIVEKVLPATGPVLGPNGLPVPVLGSQLPTVTPAPVGNANIGNIDWNAGGNITIGGRPIPTQFMAASPITLTVNVQNADEREVANKLVSGMRAQGVDI